MLLPNIKKLIIAEPNLNESRMNNILQFIYTLSSNSKLIQIIFCIDKNMCWLDSSKQSQFNQKLKEKQSKFRIFDDVEYGGKYWYGVKCN